ncbi:hypothetical protein ACFQY5_10090 [Paeniroseomonas aquatica]|uniref:hypothetical protein n=1 Tax=Paeniroseomonas aquatica TaxID=373043 RepID=UPI00360900B9
MAVAWAASTGSPASPGAAVTSRWVAVANAGPAAAKAMTPTPGGAAPRDGSRKVPVTCQPAASASRATALPL